MYVLRRSLPLALAWALPSILILFAPSPAFSANPAFVEIDLGMSIVNGALSDTDGFNMQAGGTVGDFNNDGWPDIFVVGGGGTTDTLLINNQAGGFDDESVAWGLTELYRGNGATAGDFDDDGWVDVFVTSFGDLPGPQRAGQHRLYRNNGDGSFTNVATDAGVNFTWNRADGMGAAFGDYDLDGDLDLFVGGWFDRQGSFEGTRLFRNDGDGTFTDVTAPAGVLDGTTRAFGAIFADMDGDRFPELLVAGDFGTSRYYVNNRDGTFTKSNVLAPGSDKVHNGMGTTVADVNRDGKLDWFVTSIFPAWFCEGPPGNRLYINESSGVGDHQIRAAPEAAGVNDGGWGWGTAAIDFDHDAWIDIVHTGGWWRCFDDNPDKPADCENECFMGEQSYLFQNNGDETFMETALDFGFDHTLQGRGLVHLDYDKDGDIDVAIFANGEPMKLFRNDLSGVDAHWLKVYADTSGVPELAPGGFGTHMVLEQAGQQQVYRITGGSNYLGRGELVAHFGVHNATTIDELTVIWASGFRTVLNDIAADQEIVVTAVSPHSSSPVVRGEETTLTVNGLIDGDIATFLGSGAGFGAGPCPGGFGGICADILNPNVLGTAVADASGTATLTIVVPAQLPDEAFTQVLIARGVDGLKSLKSNVVVTPVAD